jgi:K+-transporting ATPase ATPase B chain
MLKPWIYGQNPVMFITEVGAILTTIVLIKDVVQGSSGTFSPCRDRHSLVTVLFANFAEALAEARGKAQANTLKQNPQQDACRRVVNGTDEQISSDELREGDVVLCGCR